MMKFNLQISHSMRLTTMLMKWSNYNNIKLALEHHGGWAPTTHAVENPCILDSPIT